MDVSGSRPTPPKHLLLLMTSLPPHLPTPTLNFWAQKIQNKLPSLKLTARTCNTGVGRWVSFWEGLFSVAMLVSGRVILSHQPHAKKNSSYHNYYLQQTHFWYQKKSTTCFRGKNAPPTSFFQATIWSLKWRSLNTNKNIPKVSQQWFKLTIKFPIVRGHQRPLNGSSLTFPKGSPTQNG